MSRGVEIVDGATVPVAIVATRTEAELIVGMLRSNGLRAAVSADDAGGQEPQLQLQGVRVLVASSDEAAARQLLAEAEDTPPVGRSTRQPMDRRQLVAFEFERVTVRRAGRRVLDEVTARIPAAGIAVIAGPSGAGKTTLLRLCNRLEVPDAGTVGYRGRPLDEVDPLALRRRVGMVFQRPTPFPGNVADNLAVAHPDAGTEEMTIAL